MISRLRVVRLVAVASVAIGLSACGSGTQANRPSTGTASSSIAVGASSPQAASAATRPFELKLASTGRYLTDGSGRALYTFDNDSTVSSCNGPCAVTWPPFIVASGETAKLATGLSGNASTGERADGSFQVAYNGKPLYFYSADTAAGDTKGDGFGGVWHLATP